MIESELMKNFISTLVSFFFILYNRELYYYIISAVNVVLGLSLLYMSSESDLSDLDYVSDRLLSFDGWTG